VSKPQKGLRSKHSRTRRLVCGSIPSDRALVVAGGVTVFEALAAYEQLQKDGLSIRVIDLFSVHPSDREELIGSTGAVVITVEDHYEHGGLGDAVLSALAQERVQAYKLAVREGAHSGTAKEALETGLTPIVCVGERERQNMKNVLIEQFHQGIGLLSKNEFAGIVIAYKPVWAIGTGNADTPESSNDAHRIIRAQAEERFGDAANDVRILYGGSAKPDNAKSYLAQPQIDGPLLGGASLDPAGFADIVNL